MNRGKAHIPTRNLGEPKGGTLLGRAQIRWDRGSTPWSGYLSKPVSEGEVLQWGKVLVQPGIAHPYHYFYWKVRKENQERKVIY